MKNNQSIENSYSAYGTETGRHSTQHPNYSASPYPSHTSEPLPNPPEHASLHDQLSFGTPVQLEETATLRGIPETEVLFINPNSLNSRPNVLTLAEKTGL